MLNRANGPVAALAVALALALVLAACHQGKGAKPPASEAPAPSTTAPATTLGGATGAAIEAPWPTYHQNLARGGVAQGPGTLGTVRRAWTSPQLDGAIYAEPLIAGGGVVVATEHDSVYLLEQATGKVAWHRNLGAPVPQSELPCGNIDPVGITSTPVVDPASGLLYVVALLRPAHHELFALDLASGAVRFHRDVDPPGSDATVQNQRGALALSRGRVYIPYGGRFGDCGQYHGYVVGAPADNRGGLLVYQVPTHREGGIWAPSGPSLDAAGALYVSTGNGDSTGSFDFGDSVVKLGADLRRLDWFAPREWAQLNAADADLGSVGPALLGGQLAFQIGKSGVGYLLRTNHLGGLGGEAFSAQVCGSAFGGTAWAPPLLYVPCSEGLVALRVDVAAPSFTVAWRASAASGPPIVAGGAVWSVGGSNLVAFNSAGRVVFQQPIGEAARFATPAAGDGRVLVAATNRVVAFAYGG
jgi:outer membrane protein assembly factor BamB